jgi:IS605 OrfB family transposase
MKLTIQVQMIPSAEQAERLLRTFRQFNAAASYAAKIGFDNKVFSQISIHKRCYYDLREKFGLSSQMAVRAIGKAVECFARDKTRLPVFKPLGAMTYDERLFSFRGVKAVSILTVDGREHIPIVFGEYQKERFDRCKGQVDIVYRDKKFYVLASADFPEKAPIKPKDFVGVDLGVARIATTSDGKSYNGAKVESVRQRYFTRRQTLQKAAASRKKRGLRPRSIRRALQRLSGREERFRKDTDHCISKQLVADAKGTSRGIALEDLTHIRERTRFKRQQRAKMAGWSFAQLRTFIEYKALLDGVPVRKVDPRDTSRTCSECGHCEKANRKSQSEFVCKHCVFSTNADYNAARNVRAKALVNEPKVPEKQRRVA